MRCTLGMLAMPALLVLVLRGQAAGDACDDQDRRQQCTAQGRTFCGGQRGNVYCIGDCCDLATTPDCCIVSDQFGVGVGQCCFGGPVYKCDPELGCVCTIPCRNNSDCCDPTENQQCITFPDGHKGCCPPAQVCSNVCCNPGQTCVDGPLGPECGGCTRCGSACCTADEVCVNELGGGQCCPEAQVCTGRSGAQNCCDPSQSCVDGQCCSRENECGPKCCGAKEKCVDAERGYCCPLTTSACYGGFQSFLCCESGETCCVSASGQRCCPSESVCTDKGGCFCGKPKAPCKGDDACCDTRTAQCCETSRKGHCAPIGWRCCGDGFCSPGEGCCASGQCYDPSTQRCCGVSGVCRIGQDCCINAPGGCCPSGTHCCASGCCPNG